MMSKTTDNAVNCSNAIFRTILPHHGLPDDLASDRHEKITSKLWGRLMSMRSEVEDVFKQTPPDKWSLRSYEHDGKELLKLLLYHQNSWDELLPTAEFAYNSAVREYLGKTPLELVFGGNQKSSLDTISGAE